MAAGRPGDQYGDRDSVIARQLEYWRHALAGVPEQVALPIDGPARRWPSYRGVEGCRCGFRRTCTPGWWRLRGAHGVTMFMVLQGALAVLLARLGAGTDIPIGSANAGRMDVALDDLVGCFVNTLVLRTDLSGDPTFADVLGRVRETEPWPRSGTRTCRSNGSSRNCPRPGPCPGIRLFQVMLTVQNTSAAVLELPGVQAGGMFDGGAVVAKFDLDLTAWRRRSTRPAHRRGCAVRWSRGRPSCSTG